MRCRCLLIWTSSPPALAAFFAPARRVMLQHNEAGLPIRTPALPEEVKQWWLTTLQEWLPRIATRMCHGKSIEF